MGTNCTQQVLHPGLKLEYFRRMDTFMPRLDVCDALILPMFLSFAGKITNVDNGTSPMTPIIGHVECNASGHILYVCIRTFFTLQHSDSSSTVIWRSVIGLVRHSLGNLSLAHDTFLTIPLSSDYTIRGYWVFPMPFGEHTTLTKDSYARSTCLTVLFTWLCSHVILVTFIFIKFRRAISRAILYGLLRYSRNTIAYMYSRCMPNYRAWNDLRNFSIFASTLVPPVVLNGYISCNTRCITKRFGNHIYTHLF